MTETEIILDKRIFTANCVLNLFGFDTKNIKNYHSVRRNIRRSLKNKKLESKERLANYINEKQLEGILVYSSLLSKPPEFEFKEKSKDKLLYQSGETIDKLEGFNRALKHFYEEAEIEKYWKKHEKKYRKYKEIAEKETEKKSYIDKAENFLNQELPFEKIQEMVCLLRPHHMGGFIAKKHKNIVITGPHIKGNSKHIYAINQLHETLHPTIHPWIEKNQDIIQESANRKEEVPKGTNGYKWYIKNSSWKYYIEESLVRAIVAYLDPCEEKIGERWLKLLENKGFIYTDLIGKEIEKYRETDQAFKEYLPNILKELSINNK